jgi:hypothetical protein
LRDHAIHAPPRPTRSLRMSDEKLAKFSNSGLTKNVEPARQAWNNSILFSYPNWAGCNVNLTELRQEP